MSHNPARTLARRLANLTQQLPRRGMATPSAASMRTHKLNTGASIPAIGFGTWQDKDAQEQAVLTALKAGYRHIDGARVYGTERAIGNAIHASKIPRSEIFLTTKLWNNAHHPADVEPQLDASLADLQTDYVDLYLMHWPSPFARSQNLFPKGEDGKVSKGDTDFVDTWKAMEGLVKKGKVRAVGVSNFSRAELERLVEGAEIIPAVHQLELHPYLQQASFHSYHVSKNIHTTAYSPLGNANPVYTSGATVPKLIDDPVLASVGAKHGGMSGAQVALAWGIARGCSVIPKSKTEGRILANLEAAGLELDGEDMEKITALDRKARFNDPSESFGWRFYADLDGV